MKSQFLKTPSIDSVVKEVYEMLNVGRQLICFDYADIRYTSENASNVVLLEGFANGSQRVSDAIKDAILQTNTVAQDFDFFTANKICLNLSCSEDNPIGGSEASEILQIFDTFNVDVIWGIGYDDSITDDTVIARLVAANLKLKNIKY